MIFDTLKGIKIQQMILFATLWSIIVSILVNQDDHKHYFQINNVHISLAKRVSPQAARGCRTQVYRGTRGYSYRDLRTKGRKGTVRES